MSTSATKHILAAHTKMTSVITNLLALPSRWHPILQYVRFLWYSQSVSFKFSYIVILLPLSLHFIDPPHSKSSSGICLYLLRSSPPSEHNSLQPSKTCETFCLFHFLPQIYIYLLLTVNFNPSHAVFQVRTMNECPLICASSSWLQVEQVGASLMQDQ
jgi:hypothetical protein